MLTSTIWSLSLAELRGFIPSTSLFTARTSTCASHLTTRVSPWDFPDSRHIRNRLHSKVTTHPKSTLQRDGILIPHALKSAAQAFEDQLRRGELNSLVESYAHLRRSITDVRPCVVFSEDYTSPRLLRSPGDVLKDAMMLLMMSARREHADLHLTMFNDLESVFQTTATMDPPMELTSKAFHRYLNGGSSNTLSPIYDHLCHLSEASPSQLEAYTTSEDNTWRVTVWMRRLARVPHKEHPNLLRRILYDLHRVFGVRPTLKHHQFVIKGLLAANMPEDAWNWLRQMERDPASSMQTTTKSRSWPGDVRSPIQVIRSSSKVWMKPLSTEYDILLSHFAKHGDVLAARMLMAHMHAMGADTAPTQRSWNTLLAGLLINPKSTMSHITAVIDELQQVGHSVDLKTLGRITGRGPLKKWMTREIFHVVHTAAIGSNTFRMAVCDTTKHSWKKDESAEVQHFDGEAVYGVDIGPGKNISNVVSMTLVKGNRTSQGQVRDITGTQFPSGTTAKALTKSPILTLPQQSQEISAIAPPPYCTGGHSTPNTSPPQATRESLKVPGAPWIQKECLTIHTDLPSSPVVSHKNHSKRFITPYEIHASVADFIDTGDKLHRPHEMPPTLVAIAQSAYLSELSHPELLACTRDKRDFGANFLGPHDRQSVTNSERIMEVIQLGMTGSVFPAVCSSIEEMSPHEAMVPDPNVTVLNDTQNETRDAASSLAEFPAEFLATGVTNRQPESHPEVCPSPINGQELGMSPSLTPAALENLSNKVSENIAPGIPTRPTHEFSAYHIHSDVLCAKSAVVRNSVNKVQQTITHHDTDHSYLYKVRREIFNAVRRGDLRGAWKYYNEFIKVSRPDIQIGDALIRALCWGTLQAPPRSHILRSLRIYKDLVTAGVPGTVGTKETFHSVMSQTTETQKLYTRVYNVLLRALSAPSRELGPQGQEQYTRYSSELLADMKTQGLRPDYSTVTSILLLRFRCARTHEEAFGSYKSLLAELETVATRVSTFKPYARGPKPDSPPLLDLIGYRAVLNAFGKLSFPSAPVAPAPLWLSIAEDMRLRGHIVTVEDYTIFLGGILAQKTSPLALQRASLGIPSSEGEEDRMRAMYTSVKHLHEQITIDPHVSPDPTLLNTLMNAYQHLGAFDDTLRIFNATWLSGRMDHVTPVIIFDACGHARRVREAFQIWCMLIGKGWRFDKQTLDTWVECLCRLGNVEAACKFVCMYMGQDKAGYLSKGDTRPDVQTCLILLKLSWVVGQNIEVKGKIRTHLPHIWIKLAAHHT